MMHVGIIVTKLDAEDHFYKDILGFSETWRGSSDSKVLSWTNLKVPDGQDYVELMLYAQPPPAEKRGTAHPLGSRGDRCRGKRQQIEAQRVFQKLRPSN